MYKNHASCLKRAKNCASLLLLGTDWAGGVYKVTMEFSEDYPSKVMGHPHDPGP